MRVAVTGAEGLLGHELCRQLGPSALPLPRADLDITSEQAVRQVLKDLDPDAVINAAAYTDVDGAETEAHRCLAVNVEGTRHVAQACRAIHARLVQISTDYVFFGHPDRHVPFREDDRPHPQGVYAASKSESETVAAECPESLIVRTCGLYANRPETKRPDFAKKILQLAETNPTVRVVDDQYCTPSYVPDVAGAILYLLGARKNGTYHVVNSGSTTWYHFAAELFRQAGVGTNLVPIKTSEFPTAAPRPVFSVLDNSKYAGLDGPPLPPWQEGITRYLGSIE